MTQCESDLTIIAEEAIRMANEECGRKVHIISNIVIPGKTTEAVTGIINHEMKRVYEFKLQEELLDYGHSMARERGETLHSLIGFYPHISPEVVLRIWNVMRPTRTIEYARIIREWKDESSAMELAELIKSIEVTGPLRYRKDEIHLSRLMRVISKLVSGDLSRLTATGPMMISKYTPEFETRVNLIGRILNREHINFLYRGKSICPKCEQLEWYR